MRPKILVADDNEFLRRGILALIAMKRPDWDLCGEAANGEETIQSVLSLAPDVVLLDICMPIMTGLEVAECIARLALDCRVVLLTAYDAGLVKIKGVMPPAHAYVDKGNLVRDLLPTIDRVLALGCSRRVPKASF